MKCPNCGAENLDEAKFCFSCGSKLEAPASEPAPAAGNVCPSCGAPYADGSAFCEQCGAHLGGGDAQAQPQPEAAAPAQEQAQQPVQAAPEQQQPPQQEAAPAQEEEEEDEESIYNEITFITSFLTFYLKGSIKLEQNFMKFAIPNTILTFIPLGKKTRSIPINQISNVDTNFRMQVKTFLLGVLFTIAGIALTFAFPPGIVVALIGAFMILNSFFTDLQVHDTSGGEIFIPIIIFQKSKAELAAEQIRKVISNRMDDTNVRIHSQANAAAIISGIGGMMQQQQPMQQAPMQQPPMQQPPMQQPPVQQPPQPPVQ